MVLVTLDLRNRSSSLCVIVSNMESASAIRLVAAFASVGGVISSLEAIWHWRSLRLWFAQPWHMRVASSSTSVMSCASRMLRSEPLSYGLAWLRLLLFLLLLCSAAVSAPSGGAALALAILLTVEMSLRAVGGDGADQMNVLICAAVAVGTLIPSPNAPLLALMFLTAQIGLAYVTAGVAKLSSRDWMRQGVLARILNTETYGHHRAARFLSTHRWVDRAMSAGVAVMEVAVPILCVMPSHLSLMIALSIGFAFHLGCALLMGLNNFLWAFVATYPAIYFVHCYVYHCE
jgi:hypothetical protein